MVVAKNGTLLSESEVETIRFLREYFINECNLDDRKFAIAIVRVKRALDLPSAMDLTLQIKETFTWID